MLYDARDYYGPYFHSNHWSIEGAMEAAKRCNAGKVLRWKNICTISSDDFESAHLEFQIHRERVLL